MTSPDQAERPEPDRAESDRPRSNLPAHDELGFLTEAQLMESGIVAGLLRVSAGLEDVTDLQRDFARAFAIAGIDVEAAAPALAT